MRKRPLGVVAAAGKHSSIRLTPQEQAAIAVWQSRQAASMGGIAPDWSVSLRSLIRLGLGQAGIQIEPDGPVSPQEPAEALRQPKPKA